jgi:hypothetical protein
MLAEAAGPSVKLTYQHGVTTQILMSIPISQNLRHKQSVFLNDKSNNVSQINQPTRCNNFSSLSLDVYVPTTTNNTATTTLQR